MHGLGGIRDQELRAGVVCGSLKNVDIFLCRDILEDARSCGDTDFTQVRFLEQQHVGTGLSNTAPKLSGSWLWIIA